MLPKAQPNAVAMAPVMTALSPKSALMRERRAGVRELDDVDEAVSRGGVGDQASVLGVHRRGDYTLETPNGVWLKRVDREDALPINSA